jgi:hypothetical protein
MLTCMIINVKHVSGYVLYWGPFLQKGAYNITFKKLVLKMSSVRQPQQQVSLRFIYRKVNAD